MAHQSQLLELFGKKTQAALQLLNYLLKRSSVGETSGKHSKRIKFMSCHRPWRHHKSAQPPNHLSSKQTASVARPHRACRSSAACFRGFDSAACCTGTIAVKCSGFSRNARRTRRRASASRCMCCRAELFRNRPVEYVNGVISFRRSCGGIA